MFNKALDYLYCRQLILDVCRKFSSLKDFLAKFKFCPSSVKFIPMFLIISDAVVNRIISLIVIFIILGVILGGLRPNSFSSLNVSLIISIGKLFL